MNATHKAVHLHWYIAYTEIEREIPYTSNYRGGLHRNTEVYYTHKNTLLLSIEIQLINMLVLSMHTQRYILYTQTHRYVTYIQIKGCVIFIQIKASIIYLQIKGNIYICIGSLKCNCHSSIFTQAPQIQLSTKINSCATNHYTCTVCLSNAELDSTTPN